MKYRLTVKGQVALVTAALLVVFAAVSFSQYSKNALKEGMAATAGPISQEQPQAAAPVEPSSGTADGQNVNASSKEVPSSEQLKEITATVYFNPDQWEMKAEEICKITEIVNSLKAYPDAKIRVEGNINGVSGSTDSSFGLDLSLKRAQVVAQVLMGKGIEESRIIIKSNGSSQPVASEQDKLWMNRRTLVYIEGFNGETP